MSNDWFRSWHGAPTDPKWLLIAKRAGVKPIHVSGTWWALLDHASQHPDRGRVDDFDVETFALFAGMEEAHVSRIVTELSAKGVIVDGCIAQWAKRQPKKEDPTAGDRKRRQRGKSGGNPPNNGGDEPHALDQQDDGHAASRDVTLDKIRGDKSSVANATGTVVPHPAADFCKAIFDSGVALLTAQGMTERNARGHLGRLRAKLNDDPAMLTLLRECEIEQPSDVAGKLVAMVETRLGTRKPSAHTNSGRRSGLVDEWRATAAECATDPAAYQEADHRTRLALPSYGS